MMERLKPEEFDQIFEIMEMSFPKDEYRTYEGQKALLSNPIYQIYILRDPNAGKIIAFAAIWEFEQVVFVEHLAVNPEYRNGGLGARILGELKLHLGKRMCLEVELPETEIAARRIGFYERNGFFLNHYPYVQPALANGQNEIPLMIMTTGNEVDEPEFQKIKALLYTQVYKIRDISFL